ncbi:MAG: FtsB family cell division protein [Alphaproteobacteria bacterium]
MIGGRNVAERLRRHAGAFIGICALTYFGYHLTLGERGLGAWLRLSGELAAAEAELELSLAAERELEHRVNLMRSENLDPDMLDEQVRAAFGYLRGDEVVVYIAPE